MSDPIDLDDPDVGRDDSMRTVGALLAWSLLVAVPTIAIIGSAAYEFWWSATLLPGTKAVPAVYTWGAVLPFGTTLLQVVFTCGFLIAVRQGIHSPNLRFVVNLVVLMVELVLAPLGVGIALIAAVPVVLTDRPEGKDQESSTGRKAFLYEVNESPSNCGWDVYATTGPLDTTSTLQTSVSCDCARPKPDADVRFISGTPTITDINGLPYYCPPPPSQGCSGGSGCDSGRMAPGMLVVGLAVAMMRRTGQTRKGTKCRSSNPVRHACQTEEQMSLERFTPLTFALLLASCADRAPEKLRCRKGMDAL